MNRAVWMLMVQWSEHWSCKPEVVGSNSTRHFLKMLKMENVPQNGRPIELFVSKTMLCTVQEAVVAHLLHSTAQKTSMWLLRLKNPPKVWNLGWTLGWFSLFGLVLGLPGMHWLSVLSCGGVCFVVWWHHMLMGGCFIPCLLPNVVSSQNWGLQ